MSDVCVLLSAREFGGHEVALLGWLGDAVRLDGLHPRIVAPSSSLAAACARAGLAACLNPPPADRPLGKRALLQALSAWPADRPLLLAPGALHAAAWLLAAAVLYERRVWVYVPMTFSARRMGYRRAWLKDLLIAPWLRRVEAWITVDEAQARQLASTWGLNAPVHVLPNRVRLGSDSPPVATQAPPGQLRLVYAGRFDLHQKGLDWLADVLLTRSAWSQRCHWLFQGAGAGEGRLLELASALGPHRVQVRPFASIDDALADCDVLILPSRFEGQSLVAMEATARGWPVVASREAGLGSLLPAACQFDFGDVDGLRAAVEGMRDAGSRREAVTLARRRLAERWSVQRYDEARARIVRGWQRHVSRERS